MLMQQPLLYRGLTEFQKPDWFMFSGWFGSGLAGGGEDLHIANIFGVRSEII